MERLLGSTHRWPGRLYIHICQHLTIQGLHQASIHRYITLKGWGLLSPPSDMDIFLFFLTEAALHSLLGALTSDTYDDTTQHLEREQALAKQFAEILHFTLRFDELKVRLSSSNIPQVSISASKPQTDLLRCWYKLCTFLLWCTPDFLVALQTADAPELIFSSVQFYTAASEHMISI